MSEQESKSNFDFSKLKQKDHEELDSFIQQKEKDIREKMYKQNKGSSRGAWFLVLLLTVSLVGVAGYGVWELNRAQTMLSQYKQKGQVAGVSEEQQENKIVPISGDWFSILPKENPPEEFKRDRSVTTSKFLAEREAKKVQFLAQVNKNGKKLLSGIEVEVIEYDRKFNKEQLNQKVLEILGDKYEVKSTDINIPKEFQLSKIDSKEDNKDGITYYATVTTDNYYIIKMYDQTAGINEFEEVNKFTENILQSLYLN